MLNASVSGAGNHSEIWGKKLECAKDVLTESDKLL